MRDAKRASSRNIARNSGSFAKFSWSRFTATVFEKPTLPSIRAKCTDAIPPDAILSKSTYRPTRRSGAMVDGGDESAGAPVGRSFDIARNVLGLTGDGEQMGGRGAKSLGTLSDLPRDGIPPT